MQNAKRAMLSEALAKEAAFGNAGGFINSRTANAPDMPSQPCLVSHLHGVASTLYDCWRTQVETLEALNGPSPEKKGAKVERVASSVDELIARIGDLSDRCSNCAVRIRQQIKG